MLRKQLVPYLDNKGLSENGRSYYGERQKEILQLSNLLVCNTFITDWGWV